MEKLIETWLLKTVDGRDVQTDSSDGCENRRRREEDRNTALAAA
jgi:hypothetical protein